MSKTRDLGALVGCLKGSYLETSLSEALVGVYGGENFKTEGGDLSKKSRVLLERGHPSQGNINLESKFWPYIPEGWKVLKKPSGGCFERRISSQGR